MIAAFRAELRRLISLRSTGVYAVMLLGCFFGPIIIMAAVYDAEYQGPIDASDIGKCISIFHVLAIIFSGAYAATEIRSGSTAIAFLTQTSRYLSLVAHYVVEGVFLVCAFAIGIPLALLAGMLYPDGLEIGVGALPYWGLYLGIVLVWSSMATSIAVITRSVAAAVATPITWMLLIEQLLAQIPMFDAITPWLPFAASHSLLARSLGEATSVYPALATAFAILSPAFLLGVLSFTLHCKRDAP